MATKTATEKTATKKTAMKKTATKKTATKKTATKKMPTKRTAVPTIPPSFAPVVSAFADDAEVTAGSMFSADTVVLKVAGKIFAMWVKGALVVKLPRERVGELVAAGAAPFGPNPRRVMKEWVTVPTPSKRWVAMAREAHGFVAGQIKTAGRRGRRSPR